MSLMVEGETFSPINHRENNLPDGRDSHADDEGGPSLPPQKNIFIRCGVCENDAPIQ